MPTNYKVIDGQIYVRLIDIVGLVFDTVESATTVVGYTNNYNLLVKTQGLLEFGQALRQTLEEMEGREQQSNG